MTKLLESPSYLQQSLRPAALDPLRPDFNKVLGLGGGRLLIWHTYIRTNER